MANFVLVHGGMIGGNCWKNFRTLLENKQHKVLTPTLTGLGERKHLSHPDVDLELHIQDVLQIIYDENLDNIILVGHSYGGMVITGVADRIPTKIKKLVYLAAVLPKDGESMFDAVGPAISNFLEKSAKVGNGWEVPAGTPQSYGINNPEMAKWFVEMSTPHPIKCFQQKLYLKNSFFPDRIYMKCTQDSVLDLMISRSKEMQIPYCEIDSGHFPMITVPELLFESIDRHLA